jgi:S1-C subfamily serine protease
MRDRDEWRRPWPEGAAWLPTSTAPAGPTAAGAATEGTEHTDGAPEGGSSGSDLSDLVADRSVGAYGTSLSGPSDPSTARATDPWSVTRPDERWSAPAVAQPAGPAGVPAQPPSRRARRGGSLPGVLGGVAGALATVLVLSGLGLIDGDLAGSGDGAATPSPAAPVDPAAPAPGRAPLPDAAAGASVIPDVADRVLPSVVRINTSGAVDLSGSGALGSGVIYRSDGYIITNHHVIEGASAVEVLLSDGDRFVAEIVGSDVLNDLAVLRIDRAGLPAIDLRPSDEPVRVGETVVAIGSPFGLDATVTSGIISALNRDLRLPSSADVIPAVIQTDAAINPGNSGGALVDLKGRLVGINTAIVSRTGTNEGVGFAVPVRQAIVSSDQLIEQGFVRYPLLGITGTDISAEVAAAFGLSNRRGAVVDTVQPGSAADEGGMRSGDVIVAVDGLPLRSMGDLVAEVRRRAPGMTVTFEVLRENERLTIEAVLGERPRS